MDVPKSHASAFRKDQLARELAAKAPTPREMDLMSTYGLEKQEAKEIDSDVSVARGLSGAILADVEQLQEIAKDKDVSKMSDDELKETYTLLMGTLGGMEYLTHELSTEEIYKIPLTATGDPEPILSKWMGEKEVKIATAVRTEAFKKPEASDAGYDSLVLVASETPHHDQYLEETWSDQPNRYHHINPEVFKLVVGMRDQVLNTAFERTVTKLRGLPITEAFLAQAEEVYGDAKAQTVGVASLTIYPELKAALQLYREAILLSQAPKIDVSDESFSKLRPVLLGVDTMDSGYSASRYARTQTVPLGRQWLEVGPDHLKYTDIVKGAAKLYREKFVDVDHRRRSREISESTTWKNSWVSPETSADIAENGMSAFLEKNVAGFDKLESPYREALANIFTAVAAQQAQEGIWQWTNSQEENFDYSVLPDVRDCLRLFVSPDDPFHGVVLKKLFDRVAGQYEANFRTMTKPSKLSLGFKKPEFDIYETINKIRDFIEGNLDKKAEILLERNVLPAMISQFEHRRMQRDSVEE